jgi:acetolactate synthase-1/2/3 large subunit
MATVADVLAEALRAAGVDTIFGLPGGENAEVLDAFRRHGMAFVLVRNESSALFMADATARLTGEPAVVLVTLGPGAANAYCGLAHAYLDRAPVLLITAQSDGRTLDRYTHQVIDLQAALRPVTKMTRELTNRNTRATIAAALHTLTAGRPGPVHLGVSTFMAGETVLAAAGDEAHDVVAAPPAPSAAAIQAARSLLVQARRPLIVAGLGVEPERPYAAIRALAEAAHAPLIVTPKAKGAISDRHPLAAGTFGLTRTDPPYAIADESDCIVAVGFDVVEMERLWDQPQPIIWVAPWPNADPVVAAVAHELVGAMGPILAQLARAGFRPRAGWGEVRVAAHRKALAAKELPPPAAGRLRPQTVFAVARRHLPDEAVVTTDVGAHKIAAALLWPTYVPNTYLLSNGLSSMGFGLPAAIAAARATGALALTFTGDGGMHMVLGELGVLREQDLPVIVVLLNDNALDLIRSAQRRRHKPVFGTEFENPDYALVARGFGLDFYRAGDEGTLDAALRTAVARRRPALIEALIDPAAYPTTP